MGFRLKDLPVYIMMGAVIGFFVYVIIKSWMPDKEKQDKEKQDKETIKK